MTRHREVEELYRGYVIRRRGGRMAEATYKLAEAIEAQLALRGDLDRVREAIRWYRRVWYRFPRTSWADQAEAKVRELAERLPEDERAAATTLTADEQIELAQDYARVHRHESAIREFTKTLEMTDPDGPIGCQAQLGRGRATYNDRERARAAKLLTETAERCDEPDLRAWALYLAGRSYTSRGNDARRD